MAGRNIAIGWSGDEATACYIGKDGAVENLGYVSVRKDENGYDVTASKANGSLWKFIRLSPKTDRTKALLNGHILLDSMIEGMPRAA